MQYAGYQHIYPYYTDTDRAPQLMLIANSSPTSLTEIRARPKTRNRPGIDPRCPAVLYLSTSMMREVYNSRGMRLDAKKILYLRCHWLLNSYSRWNRLQSVRKKRRNPFRDSRNTNNYINMHRLQQLQLVRKKRRNPFRCSKDTNNYINIVLARPVGLSSARVHTAECNHSSNR